MAKFELQPNEQVLVQEKAMFLKSKINGQGGRLTLTNQRLTFERNNPYFGLIGIMLGLRSLSIEIPLASVGELSRSKHGRATNVLACDTAEHGQLRFILTSDFDTWVEAIDSARAGA